MKISTADQEVAAASVLRFTDLGAAWSGGPRSRRPQDPGVPSNQPNNTDLTITGHAESLLQLESQGLQVDTDVLVFKNAAQAKKLVERMLKPTLGECLVYDLEKSGGSARATRSALQQLPAPKVADNATIFRVPVNVKSGGQKVAVFSDYIFVSQGRTQFFVN